MTKTTTKTRKRSVSIIGPGRLGQALAIALRSLGYPILAFVGRHPADAKKAVRAFNKSVNKSSTAAQALGWDQLAQLPATDLILITTPDDAISEAAQRLAADEFGRVRRRTV